MKFRLIAAFAVVGIAFASAFAIAAGENSSNYSAQGGADWEVGGTLNVKTNGSFTFNGVAQTGAMRGAEAALDGSNPTPVTTGFTTATACSVTLKGNSAPGDNTSVLTYDISSGTLNVYAWKNTGGTDPTLVASTGTETFTWFCTGT